MIVEQVPALPRAVRCLLIGALLLTTGIARAQEPEPGATDEVVEEGREASDEEQPPLAGDPVAAEAAELEAEEEAATGGQSRESMAADSTAAQWSFQFAYQANVKYRDDTLPNGTTRAAGNKGFFQFRMVAPIPMGPVSLLPRLTLRLSQSQSDEWGLSPTDLFGLVILSDWGTGRAGIGPDIVFPATSSAVGTTAWQYGLAGAVIQRLVNDRLMVGVLLQQVWGKTNGRRPDDIVANPLGITPFLVFQLGAGWYVQNGDQVILYDWDSGGWLIPLPIRLGHVIITEGLTYNIYGEYGTSVPTNDWLRPSVEHRFRINLSIQIPVGG